MVVNWIDIIIVAVLFIFAFEAFGKSLVWEILDFISFLIAFFISFAYYGILSSLLQNQFGIPHSLSLAIGFMGTWFLSEMALFFVSKFFYRKLIKFGYKIPGERFLATIPALFRAIIFIALFLVLIATFPIQPKVKKELNESVLGSFILKHAYRLEAPLKQVFGDVSQDSLTFLTIKPETNEKVDLGFKTEDFKPNEEIENKMIDLVNKERVDRGLGPLSFDSKLQVIAREHSADMFKRGYFSHYSPEGKSVADRADEKLIEYSVVGENLAYAPSLQLAHKGLMDSPGHKANILSPEYKKIGIGVMESNIYGLMFTQTFSD